MRSAALLHRAPSLVSCNAAPVVTASRIATSTERLSRFSHPVPSTLPKRCSFCSTSVSRSATAAAEGNWNIAKVPHRGVLEVSGRDTVKLIQGLVSNDVKRLANSSEARPAVVYAGFMNPQGRMLADVFIHRHTPLEDGSPKWLLDLDSRTLPSLLAFIKKFKLRSKVKLIDVSDQFAVVQSWAPSGASSSVPASITEKLSLDPRCPTIGYRGILPSDSSLEVEGTVKVQEGEEYTLHRILNGIGEGSLDFPEGSSLPLENNLDYMSGVDFRKGCYVGQELTARTHHTGVVRKRLLPLSFYLPSTTSPTSLTPGSVDRSGKFKLPEHLTEIRSKPTGSGGEAKPARGKAAGKFTSGIHNVGLGCLRLEQVQRVGKEGADGLEMSVLAADGETMLLVKPWIPSWWPKEEVPNEQEE